MHELHNSTSTRSVDTARNEAVIDSVVFVSRRQASGKNVFTFVRVVHFLFTGRASFHCTKFQRPRLPRDDRNNRMIGKSVVQRAITSCR